MDKRTGLDLVWAPKEKKKYHSARSFTLRESAILSRYFCLGK